MEFILDYHLHSRFSRACSPKLTLPNIALACNQKGIDIVGTADFTHPVWCKELIEQLIETEPGLYQIKKSFLPKNYRENEVFRPVRFVISSELSCIYKQGEKTRRLHLVFLIPSLEVVAKINAEFDKRGWNRKSDGRPILGISGKDLWALMLEIDPRIILIPAHIWTPYFAVFGSKSGFDSLMECFGEELVKKIPAVETGLSSDPPMNWQIKELDNYRLVSASDAHSLEALGREATMVSLKNISFNNLADALWDRNNSKIISTLEFFPEEGRYHLDGCADCKYSCEPRVSKQNNFKCPKCGRALTLGTMFRVEQLAGRKGGEKPKSAKDFEYMIPLREIIGALYDVGKNSKKVAKIYEDLLQNASELDILRAKTQPDFIPDNLWQALLAVRAGAVEKRAGYDGLYGIIKPKINKKIQTRII